MSFLEKKNNSTFFLHVNVKTNSRKQEIINNENFLSFLVRSKPIQNKANQEIIQMIKRKLKIGSNQIKIKFGLKSNKKLIELKFPERIEKEILIRKLLK
ncbi:hypothetical protein LCGC14_0733470 [marine sediment metagenome]|uniref:Uncharacterized protein n=1 Tax=marine sediment metagenome TaxID=412755 RepID=A0A0F9Q8W8_9ZZZZ|nr:MAG: hypothetical protein Lokiarch_30130 [Candidatus Lokiarchaeum sp. GC14_75]